MISSYFLLEVDALDHIPALQLAGAPSRIERGNLLDALSKWQPKEPGVWLEPAAAAALAVLAVQTSGLASSTQDWFAAASVEDQLVLLYAARNARGIEGVGDHRAIEAFLLHSSHARSTAARGDTLAWSVPQLSRQAWASQRTVLQESVGRRNASIFLPLLVAVGEDVGAQDRQGATALHWAAASAQHDADVPYCEDSHRLVKLGADVGAKDARGRTALDLALARRNWPAVRVLMNGGARPTDEQWSRIERVAARDMWGEWETWKRRRAAENPECALSSLAAGNSPCERRRR